MALDDLHPYDFIKLYGYHPDHVKQEPESECLGDTLGISFEDYFKTDDKVCKSCGEPFEAKRSTKIFCSHKCREHYARQGNAGPNGVGWVEQEVLDWLEERLFARE